MEKNLIDTGILDKEKIKELINLLKILLEQNYSVFDNKYYLQMDALATSFPLSTLLADIYLNKLRNQLQISDKNLVHKKIVFLQALCRRYLFHI